RFTARLRRSSRPALSPLARDRTRAGAVGVESGLVGRLSGAPVLPAGLRVPGRAPAARFRQFDPGGERVPDRRVDRLTAAGPDDLPGAGASAPERLALAPPRGRPLSAAVRAHT